MNSQTAAKNQEHGWAEPILLKASRTRRPFPRCIKVNQKSSRHIQTQLVHNSCELHDAEPLENTWQQENDTGIFDLLDTEDPESPDDSPRVHNTDSMAAYLEDIKNLSHLSRDGEHALAKDLHEAESLKRVYTGEWLLLFAELIDRRKTKKCQFHDFAQSDAVLHDLIRMLQTINDRKRLSNRKHNSRNAALLAHTCARDVNLRMLYRDGTVTRLKAFVRISRNDKTERLLHILRHFVRHERRSKEAKEGLVRSQLRFVVSIAKNYSNRGMSLSDLIQEGNIGLIRAIEKFDYRRGYRLSTYAGWWIRQSIIRALENKALTIRVPVYMNGEARKLQHRYDNDCLNPDTDEAQEASGHNEIVYRALQVMQEPLSLDAVQPAYTRTLHESIPDPLSSSLPDREVASFFFAKQAEKILKCLSARERTVIQLHFGLGDDSTHTLEEIGARYGISRERVRQIETAALRKMRFSANARHLRPFLDELAGR